MKKEDVKYGAYVQILKEELVPAMGCTEPIALAYAAAKAREVLGEKPDTVKIGASGSKESRRQRRPESLRENRKKSWKLSQKYPKNRLRR